MPSFIHYRQIAQLLHAGDIIAYPTEGVFGLGCAPDDAEAVMHILNIKQRKLSAGLILVSPNLELLSPWIAPTGAELKQLQANNPTPVTWIVTAHPNAPDWLTGGRDTLAVRISNHPVVTGICNAAGMALVSTSANRNGRPPARSTLKARKMFLNTVDMVVPGALGAAAGPSEIRLGHSNQTLRPQSST
jgi:L-threonylcarbamoyladenylate synthase